MARLDPAVAISRN